MRGHNLLERVQSWSPCKPTWCFGFPIKKKNVYQNHFTELELLSDLFYSLRNEAAEYSLTNCIDDSNVQLTSKITKREGKSYLYVKTYGVKGCQISLTGSRNTCQTSETIITVLVNKCAATECSQWDGPLNTNWLACINGYELKDGLWVRAINYWPSSSLNFYSICGIITFLVTVLHTILALKYGKSLLEPILHAQSLIIIVCSTSISQNWRVYLSWIQYFKLDLGFITQNYFTYINLWQFSSDRMAETHLYCNEAVINYRTVLIIYVWSLVLKPLIELCKCRVAAIFTPSTETMLWILLNLMCPFIIINLVIDLSELLSHQIASFLNLLLVVRIVYFVIMQRKLLLPSTIASLSSGSTGLAVFLILISRALLVVLFLSNLWHPLIGKFTIVALVFVQAFILLEHGRHRPQDGKIVTMFSSAMAHAGTLIVLVVLAVGRHGEHAEKALVLIVTTVYAAFAIMLVARIRKGSD